MNYETVSLQKIQEVKDEQTRLIMVGTERDRKFRQDLKSQEEAFDQKLQVEQQRTQQLKQELAQVQEQNSKIYQEK